MNIMLLGRIISINQANYLSYQMAVKADKTNVIQLIHVRALPSQVNAIQRAYHRHQLLLVSGTVKLVANMTANVITAKQYIVWINNLIAL